ncbi:MAG TPA: HAD family phosphatase [Bryobacteraceae bacterium]|nr:HAD family phosphatase [Bryobacteraceae bacterium]
MTQALIFDLGKVLIPFDWQRGYSAFASVSPFPAEEVRRRIKETGLFEGFERGQVEPLEVARRVSGILELDVTFARFQELWSSIFYPETIVPDEMLESLHARHRLLMLSNTDAIHFNWVRTRYPIVRHFDGFVLSFKVGCRKPDIGIYREAIRQAGCAPGEIFFTDDRDDNVEGALRAGIDAVQFVSLEQLERDLRSRGVQW